MTGAASLQFAEPAKHILVRMHSLASAKVTGRARNPSSGVHSSRLLERHSDLALISHPFEQPDVPETTCCRVRGFHGVMFMMSIYYSYT